MRGHVSKDKIEQLAKDYAIELTSRVEGVEEGWLGKPKGLLQVLWERGWIDELRLWETLGDFGNILLKEQETKKTKKEGFYCNISVLSSVPS